MPKPYKTVLRPSVTEFTEKKSRFIGRCFPVSSEEEAMERLAEIRKLHYDATHNCWAYSLKAGRQRFSDDGEPGGTAGMPIMDTLIRREIKDALIIVTRYFGGILLGSGGLVRAYSKSAGDALSAAGTGIMTPCLVIGFETDYGRYGQIEGFVKANSAVDSVEFLENVRFRVTVPQERAEAFMREIVERTDGRSSPAAVSERFVAVADGGE
ncbi:MAG: YigZ family protein [Clostridiales bacterium]|nr:YigZ family protein [Clostridiales bacterium]